MRERNRRRATTTTAKTGKQHNFRAATFTVTIPFFLLSLLLLLVVQWVDNGVLACTSMSGSFAPAPSAGAFSSPSAGGGSGGAVLSAARAAPNLPLSPIGSAASNRVEAPPAPPIGQSAKALLGNRVTVTEFGSDGYNSQGGGPVPEAAALNCDFEGQPCCWANVPTPTDDQIDWVQVEGQPRSSILPRNFTVDGKYLIAYATSASPSDEAQLSSCAIACASSSIRVRARHMQTTNVLLQVCQRESFPPSLGFNPLLNCQEFPTSADRMINTELVLPKASYVDIIIVASNFINERGDIALLDDIQILYESDPPDCGAATTTTTTTTEFVPMTIMPKKKNKAGTKTKHLSKTIMEVDSHGQEVDENGTTDDDVEDGPDKVRRAEIIPQVDGGRNAAQSSPSASLPAPRGPPISASKACPEVQCSFEDGTLCHYSNSFDTGSPAHGLNARFEVVKGQYMNRVTGVKQGTAEGTNYAAVFLFPREKAGLMASLAGPLAEEMRVHFQYYEGTHGVQLKACCDSVERCPFRSDRFVTVTDRAWRSASMACPKGTQRLMFLCENTRTNQGACAMDDIRVLDPRGDGTTKNLC
ncbi:hypothetical protein niasHS_006079 [Heterodera schachtii]|uniref:MAM domain-containing protein n=1 Tax=Heterodera schachtii TaxID=97005 RepID=A0ABD2JVZ4_HETSC